MKKVRTAIFYILVGMLIMGVGVWIMMPKMMLTTYESESSYEETVNKLSTAVGSMSGWRISGEFDFQKNIQDAGYDKIEKIGSIALCNPEYASMILSEVPNRRVTSIMPITIGVYENKDGTVSVSELNIKMMGKMFGGTIAKVMNLAGEDVTGIITAATK